MHFCLKVCVIGVLHLMLCTSVVWSQETVRFISLGDWGYPGFPGPPIVADLMAEWSEANDCQFILTTGDNFYPNGVTSVDDPYFDYLWRYRYNHTSLVDLRWYITVGNHDYGRELGEVWVQIDFGKIEDRWYLPNLWYSNHVTVDNEDIHLIAIDTELIGKTGNSNITIMMNWLEEELRMSTSKWKIVYGHRPIYSAGEFGPMRNSTRVAFENLLIQYNVDIYLVGHDHNLQHLQAINQTANNVDHVVSGGGGAGHSYYNAEAVESLNNDFGMRVNFFTTRYGFVAFVVSADSINMQWWTIDTGLLYEYTRRK